MLQWLIGTTFKGSRNGTKSDKNKGYKMKYADEVTMKGTVNDAIKDTKQGTLKDILLRMHNA